MGLPTKCFTCGKVVGHLWQPFLNATAGNTDPAMQRLYVNVEVNEANEIRLDGVAKTPAEVFFEEKKLRRICCRRMLLCQPPHFPSVLEHQIPVNSRIAAKPKV